MVPIRAPLKDPNISISLLPEKAAQVSYQGLRLVPASYSDDHDGKHDWRSKDLFRLSEKVPGSLVLPINPDVASHSLCDAFFLFQSSELMAVATSLRDDLRRSHRKDIPQVKPSDHFPYQEQDGESLYYSYRNSGALISPREGLFHDRARRSGH